MTEMRANKFISKREHALLMIFSLLISCFVFAVFAEEIVRNYNIGVAEVQREFMSQAGGLERIRFSGGGPQLPAGLHFLAFPVTFFVVIAKRFFLSTLLTLFYAACFAWSIFTRLYWDGYGQPFPFSGDLLDGIYRRTDLFDQIAACFISVLLVWQTTILIRIYTNFRQTKNQLS